jgi:hypothetical protein
MAAKKKTSAPKKKAVAKPKKAAPPPKAKPKPKKKAVTVAPKAAPSKPAKDYGKRPDFGAEAEAYLAKVKGEPRKILDELRRIIKAAVPGVEESIKWGRPIYSKNGMIAYIKAFSNHVSLGLMAHAKKLDDPDGRIEGESGIGGHVKLTSMSDIDAPRFTTWLKTVAAANAER